MKPDKDKEKFASKKPGGKVFDVRRPGKAPASPTSRPVIMGHKPEAQEAQAAVSGIGEARPLMTKRNIRIVPIGGAVITESCTQPTIGQKAAIPGATPNNLAKDRDALASVASAAATGPSDLPSEDQPNPAGSSGQKIEPTNTSDPGMGTGAETSEPQKAEPELAAEEQPTETTSVPEEPTDQTAQLDEDPAPEPVIEPLFDDSGIVVSNHDHHHRHHALKAFGLLLLIILLAAVTFNVLLDLNLLELESVPHTNFL